MTVRFSRFRVASKSTGTKSSTAKPAEAKPKRAKKPTPPPAEIFDGQLRLYGIQIPPHVREFRFHATRRWRFDFAWPAHKVAVEIDGGTWIAGRHSRGPGYRKDCEKLNEAILLGWKVFKFTSDMVKDGAAINTIMQALWR